MGLLIAFMRLLHVTIGVSLPKPEDEKKVALLWVVSLVGIAVFTALVGYFLMTTIVSSR